MELMHLRTTQQIYSWIKFQVIHGTYYSELNCLINFLAIIFLLKISNNKSEDAVLIKKLIENEYKQEYNKLNFGFKKQKISYWINKPIKKVIYLKSKLKDEVIKKIEKMNRWQKISQNVAWELEK